MNHAQAKGYKWEDAPACTPIIQSKFIEPRVPAVVVEIGVASGQSTVAFLKRYGAFQLVGVDPYTDYASYDEKAGRYGDYYCTLKYIYEEMKSISPCFTLLKLHSIQAADLFKERSVDLVFVDGNHAYDYVRSDCNAWWPKIKYGGWLTGHDWNLKVPFCGVQKAVREFSEEKNHPFMIFPAENGFDCWGMQRREEW